MTGPVDGGFADPIQAPGTSEAEWQAWPGWAGLPETALGPFDRVVVVAAHPDDEVLGFGGAIALLAASGTEVTVVAVTDGEGSHPDSDLITPSDLVKVRAAETRAALAELGAADSAVVRLQVPDTKVVAYEDEVTARIARLVDGADLVVAPWTGDVHGDHEAAGRAAARGGFSGRHLLALSGVDVALGGAGRPPGAVAARGPHPAVPDGAGPEAGGRGAVRQPDRASGPEPW